MTQQFTGTSASDFASFVSTHLGRSRVLTLNKQDGRERVRSLVGDIERLTRYRYFGQELSYDKALYELSRAIVSGRTGPYTNRAIWSLNTRDLCKLVFTLSCEVESGQYGSYLNHKFLPPANTQQLSK